MKARKTFQSEMLDFIFQKVDKIHSIKNVNTSLIEWFFDNYILDELDDILIGKPQLLIEINDKVSSFIEFSPDIKKGVKYVFDYDLFTTKAKKRYDAYKLAETLDISTCTFCNRNYTSTVIKINGKKLTRPQFDHYFDKATYPLLALSFYNLIPSCSICNTSIKGTTKMNLGDYLHPYIDNRLSDIQFTYKYSSDTKSGLKIKVLTSNPPKAKNTVEGFAIEEIYNSHIGELLDLLKTRQYFSDKYLSILNSSLLKDVIISKEELYRIVFGAEYDEKNFINRPFSKFKSDILKELGIIS